MKNEKKKKKNENKEILENTKGFHFTVTEN